MWLLGLYVGDGNLHLSTKTYRVQFAIPAPDVELRAEVTRVVKDLFGLRCIAADEYRVVVNSKALTEWIVELGFAGVSLTKQVRGLGLCASGRPAAGIPRRLGRRRRLCGA